MPHPPRTPTPSTSAALVRRFAATVALAASCGADRELEDPAGESTAVDAPAVDDGADGDSASIPLPGPDAPYPYCESNDGDYAPYCPPTWGGHGFMTWQVDGDTSSYCETEECNTCLCYASCQPLGTFEPDASLCALPTSGTAQPECLSPQPACYLTCDDGAICPDGMQCVDNPDLQRSVCAWVSP